MQWDHPRIRGEHQLSEFKNITDNGSPPHTRGTQYYKALMKYHKRITPAYAGNTYNILHFIRLYKDHPRIRGEHLPNEYIEKMFKGSPPHTRGTPLDALAS